MAPRDSGGRVAGPERRGTPIVVVTGRCGIIVEWGNGMAEGAKNEDCLLYTSDAADE